MICGDCGKSSPSANWKSRSKKRKRYDDGSHGAKGREQKRYKTSGTTHQSEHTVGYEVFGHGAKRGKSEFAKWIENTAPAYQEEKKAHRGHIGTGNWKDYRGTGASSENYRRDQRQSVADGRVGDAVQLNQLNYAFQPEFRSTDAQQAKHLATADLSFQNMVQNFQPVPLWNGQDLNQVPVTDFEKAEMNLARMTARSGLFPNRKDEIEQMKQLGIIIGMLEKLPKRGPAMSHALDIHGIPKDGNCLFHSIWQGLMTAGQDQAGFVTNRDLREQAVGFLQHDPDVQALGVAGPEYRLAMAADGTWGGELEAMALAHIWGVRITINAPDYQITYNAGAHAGFDIYYDGVGHYSVGPLWDVGPPS